MNGLREQNAIHLPSFSVVIASLLRFTPFTLQSKRSVQQVFLIALLACLLLPNPVWAESVDGALIRRAANSAAEPQEDAWRRTTQGWERKQDWPAPPVVSVTAPAAEIHPLLVGLFVLGTTCGTLLALSKSSAGS